MSASSTPVLPVYLPSKAVDSPVDSLPSVVWHYTYDHPKRGVQYILRTQTILPPFRVLKPDLLRNKGHRADAKLVLFSTRQDWEPASYRGWKERTGEEVDLIHREDYIERGLFIYRIGVERKILKPYQHLVSIVRMPKEQDRNIKADARRVGSNPYDWWGSVHPVTADKWRAIEVFAPDSTEWTPYDGTPVATAPPVAR